MDLIPGVRIWSAHLDGLTRVEVETLTSHLEAGERARAARFHFEPHRRRSAATRGLLRSLLGSLGESHPAALRFVSGTHGKPELTPGDDRGRLRFNLSHSAGWALFAVTRDREVGIDLESGERLAGDDEELRKLAARVLSGNEFAAWQKLPDAAARRAAFLRAWVRKEAFTKATGAGISETFTGIEVALDAADPQPVLLLRRAIEDEWEIQDLPAPAGFFAAVAVAARHSAT